MTDVDPAPFPEPSPSADVAPVGPAPAAPTPPTPPARRRGPLLVAALAVVAALVLAGLWISAAGEVDDLSAEQDDRREVEEVAAAFGEAYLTYDFADEEGAADDAITALATDAFAEDYEDNRAPQIFELLRGLETTTRATTTEVFVSGIGTNTVRAFVVIDVAASSPADGDLKLTDWSFVLDLVEEDGEWRVDAVAPAPQPDVDEPAGGGSSTTAPDGSSTTVPVDSSSTTAAG